MTKEMQFSAGVWMLGQFVDRYATDGYGPPVGTLEAIDRAGQVGDLNPDPAAAEGVHPGAKSVNQWREEFLRDFAARMLRCKSPFRA